MKDRDVIQAHLAHTNAGLLPTRRDAGLLQGLICVFLLGFFVGVGVTLAMVP